MLTLGSNISTFYKTPTNTCIWVWPNILILHTIITFDIPSFVVNYEFRFHCRSVVCSDVIIYLSM